MKDHNSRQSILNCSFFFLLFYIFQIAKNEPNIQTKALLIYSKIYNTHIYNKVKLCVQKAICFIFRKLDNKKNIKEKNHYFIRTTHTYKSKTTIHPIHKLKVKYKKEKKKKMKCFFCNVLNNVFNEFSFC